MCFGNNQNTQTQTTTPPSWLSGAAQSNLNFAQGLQSQGFQGYKGNQVASFSPQQQQSFGQGGDIASATSSTLPAWAPSVLNYTTAGPGSVTPSSIASRMSPYMNQYVDMALQPQLAQAARTYMLQSQANQGAATSAGAFGDPRANLLQSNLGLNYALENQGLVGNAYNAAFNTAIGAGAQDVSNDVNAQTTNAGLREQALNRQLTGANTILGADTSSTNLLNTLGGQQTAQSQAQLNAMYNQWLMKQQYPFQTTALMNQTLAASRAGAPTTTTTSSPNNAGYGLIGAGIGAAGTIGGAMVGGPMGAAIGGSLGSAAGSGLGGYEGNINTPANPSFYADGGDIDEGQPAIIGERGPELFVPHTAGNVIPYEKLKKAIANKQGVRKTKSLSDTFGLAA